MFSSFESGRNKYGNEYREEIIQSVIRRAIPKTPFGFFNICPLNNAAKILNIAYEGNDAYRLLSSFHCVTKYQIPRSIRKRLPEFIREALTEAGAASEQALC